MLRITTPRPLSGLVIIMFLFVENLDSSLTSFSVKIGEKTFLGMNSLKYLYVLNLSLERKSRKLVVHFSWDRA